MSIHLRPERALFRFSGPDAHKLVNDVVTGHVPHEGADAAWWALLTPQGKILAEGLAGWADDALWLDVHPTVADDFLKRMKMYRLRAKAEIEDLRATHRVGFSLAAPDAGLVHRDRLGPVSLGFRVIADRDAAADWSTDDTPYHAARIAAGIAELGSDFAPGDIFAHDIGMDQLEGIDFAKGCYVGQEVVSRMKHRGTARRRPVIVSGIEAEPGAPIMAGGRDSGTIGTVVAGDAVGIVRLDRITDLAGVTVADKPVTLGLPSWARYAFGESGAED